jgi:hypothetical protein
MTSNRSQSYRYLLLFTCVSGIAAAADGIAAQGVVVDANGRAVPNAVVLARKIPMGVVNPRSPFHFARAAGDVDQSVTAVSGADGSFMLQGLLNARYSVCAEFPDQTFLNTCTWSGDYVIDMSVSNQLGGITLVVKPAVVIRIDLLDPAKLVGAFDQRFGGPVVVGVKSGVNGFYVAKLVSQDAVGLHYQIAVPVNEPVRLWLFSRTLGIMDSTGNALNNLGSELPFQANTSAVPAFAFTVTRL